MSLRTCVALALCLWTLAPVRSTVAQPPQVLHIKVTLAAEGAPPEPVRRYALLISDDPVTAAPRRVVTGVDGTVDVRLRPGTYTVEAEQPVPFRGMAYEWTRSVTIAAGQDQVLELTVANAEVVTVPLNSSAPDLESVFDAWNDSVVGVWTETGWGLGFLVDARGLIVTDQRVVGPSKYVEVQVTPAVKVAARIIAADQAKGVAVLWVDPKSVASVRPVRLGYAQSGEAQVEAGQPVFAIGRPLGGAKFMTRARVGGVDARSIDCDIIVDRGSAGSPVFASDGRVIGITTLGPRHEDGSPGTAGVIRIDSAREVIDQAAVATRGAEPPSGIPLPAEPSRIFTADALKKASEGRAGSLGAYQVPAADFDVSFITPVLTYGARALEERTRHDPGRRSGAGQGPLRALDDFNNWADYVDAFPPVLLIRVTPKLVEGFWAAVGRAAAGTQGVSLPASMHVKTRFARLQIWCGAAEVTPIHRFKIEQPIGVAVGKGTYANDTVYEGLYVVDPNALGPHCGTAKIVLFSEKSPDKGDTRAVDATVLERIWQDFALWRTDAAR